MRLQHITCNLAGLVRHAKLEGRDYLVVPTVILTEGVHSGSNGPLFYPAEELQASAATWNHKPLLVYHAMANNGSYTSASDPDVIERQKVGFLLNTKWKNGKLHSEAWIESSRANQVDSRILTSINNGVMIEVSTGLFTENEPTAGEFKGHTYSAIARNYQPDHLALLPDQVGACSVTAGCGMLRLNHAVPAQTQQRLKRVIDKIVRNEMLVERSAEDVRRDLDAILRKKFQGPSSVSSQPISGSVWTQDVFDNHIIYDLDGQLYKQSYTNTDKGSALVGEPEKVIRSTVYTKIDNISAPVLKKGLQQALDICSTSKTNIQKSSTANSGSDARVFPSSSEARNSASSTNNEVIKMNRAQVINLLVASEVWNEGDRVILNAMSDDKLQLLAKTYADDAEREEDTNSGNDPGKKKKEAMVPAGQVSKGTMPFSANEDGEDGEDGHACPCRNSACPLVTNASGAVTAEQWVGAAPIEIREILTNGLNSARAEKAALIRAITTNADCGFTAKELEGYSTPILKKMAALAKNQQSHQPQPVFYGAVGGALTDNVADEEPLVAPTMNFAEYRKSLQTA